MQYPIRDARDDDSWDLIGLVAGCWSEYPGCVLDVHGEVPELLGIKTHYDELGGRFWVAEDPRGLAGSAGVVSDGTPGVALLQKMYVARRARRQGLATRLLALVEEEARGRGATRIELWTDTRFADAHLFYERQGYLRSPDTRDLHDLSNSTEYHYVKVLNHD